MKGRPCDRASDLVLAWQDEMTGAGFLPQPEGRPSRVVRPLVPARRRSTREPPVIPATPERMEALSAAIASLAAAFACEGCGEPGGHTTDCTVKPGRLAPHGTRAAAVRHEWRGEDPCEACLAARREYDTVSKRKWRAREREAA